MKRILLATAILLLSLSSTLRADDTHPDYFGWGGQWDVSILPEDAWWLANWNREDARQRREYYISQGGCNADFLPYWLALACAPAFVKSTEGGDR